MERIAATLFAFLPLALANAPAEAGRPRGITVLDADTLVLPYIEQDDRFDLYYARGSSGGALLLDGRPGDPLRATPLGFTAPLGSDKGSYTATPEGSAWAAFASPQGVRVFELGDLAAEGPLDPAPRDAIAMEAGFDPDSVSMGIIAILIGLVAEPRPALFVDCSTDGCGGFRGELVLGWDGAAFEPVKLLGEEGGLVWYAF